MKWNGRTRCALVCLVFIALFSVFSFRLVYLQMIKHDEYAGLAAEKHGYKQAIYAERGAIFDANNEVLAHNVPGRDGRGRCHAALTNSTKRSRSLARALKIPAGELSEKLRSDRPYIVLKREVPEAEAVRLRDKLQRKKSARHSPRARFARAFIRTARCSVTSSVSPISSISGIQGVESSMEEYLHGQDGYRYIEHNRAGPGDRALPRAGTRAARRLSGAPDGRSESAKHRRERNRRRDARISRRKRRRSF